MRESWQSARAEIEGYTGDGWAAWGAVNGSKLRAFDAELSEDTRKALKKLLQRDDDSWFEQCVVEMLLAELWRSPHKSEDIVQFVKAVGLSFSLSVDNKFLFWFETRLLEIVFTLADCEPVLRASAGLDICFREFIHPVAPRASDADDKEPQTQPGHQAAFEAALLSLVERYGVPQHPHPEPSRPPVQNTEAMVNRRKFTLKVVEQIDSIVERIASGGFANEVLARQEELRDGGDAAGCRLFSRKPTLPMLQKACVLRLQVLNATLMHLPDDDGQRTAEMLRSVIKTIKTVCSCAHLMSNSLGDTVYRTALSSMDRVGSLTKSVDWLNERSKKTKIYVDYALKFREDMRRVLLQDELPRFVSEHLNVDLPLANVRMTSSGIVRHLTPPAADEAHQSDDGSMQPAEQPAKFEDATPFDVDPWLLLEHNPKGVLKERLATAKRRPRKKLKWEFEQPRQAQTHQSMPSQQRPAYHPAPSAYGHMQHQHMLHGASNVGAHPPSSAYPPYPHSSQPPASGHYYPHHPSSGASGGYGGGWR